MIGRIEGFTTSQFPNQVRHDFMRKLIKTLSQECVPLSSFSSSEKAKRYWPHGLVAEIQDLSRTVEEEERERERERREEREEATMAASDDDEASLLALLSNMDEENEKEEANLAKMISDMKDDNEDETAALEAQILKLGVEGAGAGVCEDEAAMLERQLLAMPDEDDLEKLINSLPDDDAGCPARSAEELRQLIREEKLAALKYKRSGDLERARERLRNSKALQQELEAVEAKRKREEEIAKIGSPPEAGASAPGKTAEEYKQLAVQMRREGKMELARKYLRMSKQIKASPSPLASPSPAAAAAAAAAASSSSPSSIQEDIIQIPPEYLLGDDEWNAMQKKKLGEEEAEVVLEGEDEEEEPFDAAKMKEAILEQKRTALWHKREGRIKEAKEALLKSKELQAKFDLLSA